MSVISRSKFNDSVIGIHLSHYYFNGTRTKVQILIANASHQDFAQIICDEMESSAKARGTGIAKRSPDYIKEKCAKEKRVIAFYEDGIWAAFVISKPESW